MAEPQLSVRSAKARDLAHRLARRDNSSMADVVERPRESNEIREAGREPASTFYGSLIASTGVDIDLDKVIREARQVHSGLEL